MEHDGGSETVLGREDQWQTLVSAAADAIVEIDHDGMIVAANPGLAALVGRDGVAGLVGTDARALVSPPDRDRTESWLRELARSGEAHRDLDVELIRADAALVPVEVSAAITRGVDGAPRSAVLVIHDLSVRRRAEEALRRAHDYLRDVLNAVPSPIFVKNRQHQWIFCNDAFTKLLGSPREVLLGRSDYDFVPHEQASVFWAKDEEVFASGAVNENEEVIDAADGRRTILTRKSLFRDASGADVLVATITDLTERKRAEELLRLSAQVFEHSAQGIVLTDPRHRILSVNRAFTRITGYDAGDVVGRNARVLGTARGDAGLWRDVWDAVHEHGCWAGEVVNRSRDGQIYPAWLTISAVRDDDGRLANYVTLLADASEHQAREARLRWLAQHDVLTELPNRLLLMDRLQQALLQARRSHGAVALLMIDLDRFKPVNDTHGHEAGDQLLYEVGRRMRAVVRESDTVARIGGDEFVVVLANVHGSVEAGDVASKLISVLGSPFVLRTASVQIGASIGIAVFPDGCGDVDTLIGAADGAMYRAKEAGGSAYRYAGDDSPPSRDTRRDGETPRLQTTSAAAGTPRRIARAS